MGWQVGNFALCVTPGSMLEDRLVMVISTPVVDPSTAVIVYWVHSVTEWIEPIERERGAFKPGEPVH